MKTLVIVINKKHGDDYPVEAYFDDGTANWQKAAGETGTIAAGLTTEPYLKGPDSKALDLQGLVDFVQKQDRPSAFFGDIGAHLWSLFDRTPIGAFVAATWAAHAKKLKDDIKPGIRTIFDIRAAELRKVPWELMIRDTVPLFASPLNPALRGPLEPEQAPPATGMILKVLVAIGSLPNDNAVKAEEEEEALEDAARLFRREVDLHIVRRPDEPTFTKELTDFAPHVLHFTGHAGEYPRPNKTPLSTLIFYDGRGKRWDWTTDGIQAKLAGGAPRLVVLNACRTAAGARPTAGAVEPSARTLVSTLSDQFLAAGVLGVVAMQADIAGSQAAEMAGAAYSALARGEPLDAALAQARFDARERDGQVKSRDWSLPSLHVRVPVEDILPPRLKLSVDRRDSISVTPEFIPLKSFVDRRVQRREVDPLGGTGAGGDVLIVDGPSESGKSSMMLWFLEGCAWCGHTIKYVNLKRDRRVDFLEVLQLIVSREPGPPSDLREALNGDFKRFGELAAVIRSGQPGPAGTPDDPIDALFATFRASLVQTAAGQPLIVGLDNVGSMDATAFRNYLRPFLLDYAVQRKMRPVRFVLSCTEQEAADLKLDTLQPVVRLTIKNFKLDEFDALYRDYMLAKDVPRGKIPVINDLRPNGDFPPQLLSLTYDLLKRFGKVG